MPTPIPTVAEAVMHDLIQGLLTILGARLLGVYVGGSAALGDFCEATSDLDFLVVTEGFLSMEDQIAVKQLHAELLSRHGFASRLEGDYAPLQALVPTGTTVPVPGCERGLFIARVGEIMLSADNIYNMREHGIHLYGPPPAELLPVVSHQQVRGAVQEMLAEGPEPFETVEEAAASLLNLVRSFLALAKGEPVTKSEGATWALHNLPAPLRPAIEAAVAVRSGKTNPALFQPMASAIDDLHQHWPEWDPISPALLYQKTE
ncbi:MAG TPA: aminoglycoside adenylyltransferase domain-containing protein [Symbiobacteriaceae bacterium]|nr:aminoglycoside adenylyltransferase domain-containing protein [Symbiobacteriaceae bacterium]